MKIVYSSIIPFRGFLAINLFGVLFVRKELKDKVKEVDINHEGIHTAQMKEMLYVFFYLWYFIEWFIKLFKYGGKAYRNISFEREAYAREADMNYLKERKHFAWWSEV